MAKSSKLTEQQQLFVDSFSATLSDDYDSEYARMKAAADAAGYSEKTNPILILRSKPVKEAIREVLKDYLISNGFKAAQSLVKVLHNPTAPGNKQLIDAAKEVLDRSGIVKDSGIELDDGVSAAVLIIPAKNINS